MRLLIAGGGTGGHLFPGVAVAEEVRARDPAAPVLFVGTARGIEARVLPGLGWELALIEVSGLKTVGALGAARGLARLPRALAQSLRLVRRFDPDAVLGVGGYASGPVVLAARLLGHRTAILEQNSIPGLANRILGRGVGTVFLAFDETRRFFRADKIVMSGNPIRAAIRDALAAPRPPRGARPHLFVFGGSQGAVALNQLVADGLALVAARGPAPTVLHQTGEADLEATRARYRAAGIDADCRPFVVDMAAEYRRADLVIARAGATTVAELTCVGVPALLVPYPHAADDHQTINAGELARAGAARLLRQAELTPARLADEIERTLADPAALARMGSAMNALGRPRAAATIVDWCEGSHG
jgi:UDP-N-acetylglucosamine--N-acetylmuramyl-(pentapeptide) pyrophosphoryl-undecaprenol N-acetylglucosamine transferase